MKNGQKEQKRQKELNFKVIENLKREIQVRTNSLTKIRNLKIAPQVSFLQALKVGQEEQTEELRNYHRDLDVKVYENLQSVIQVRP